MKVMVAAFSGLGYALAARTLLLLALIGGFVLAVMAMMAQTTASLLVFALYALLVIGPTAFLEFWRRSA